MSYNFSQQESLWTHKPFFALTALALSFAGCVAGSESLEEMDVEDESADILGEMATNGPPPPPWQLQEGESITEGPHRTGQLGFGVALSADGLWLVVSDVGFGGAAGRGAVHIYTRSENTYPFVWQDTIVEPADSDVKIGYAVALSADATTLAIGTIAGTSEQPRSGPVRILSRTSVRFRADQTLRGPEGSARFGNSLAFGPDARSLVVGDRDFRNLGAVHIYTRTNATTAFGAIAQTISAPSLPRSSLDFGCSIALSSDGLRLAVGDWGLTESGGVHVYVRTGTTTAFKRSRTLYGRVIDNDPSFSFASSLAWDGQDLVVGDRNFQTDGAVHVYAGARSLQQTIVGTVVSGRFGQSVAVAGGRMAVGDSRFHQPTDQYPRSVGAVWLHAR